MKDYNINGTIIIGCDHGYGNIKTAHSIFKTSVITSDTPPIFSRDYIEYQGKYYIKVILLIQNRNVRLNSCRLTDRIWLQTFSFIFGVIIRYLLPLRIRHHKPLATVRLPAGCGFRNRLSLPPVPMRHRG